MDWIGVKRERSAGIQSTQSDRVWLNLRYVLSGGGLNATDLHVRKKISECMLGMNVVVNRRPKNCSTNVQDSRDGGLQGTLVGRSPDDYFPRDR